jgi:hypothetical protein
LEEDIEVSVPVPLYKSQKFQREGMRQPEGQGLLDWYVQSEREISDARVE